MAPIRNQPIRNQRGAVFPSPVVILSILAVAMAAVAFVATRGGEPTEREVAPVVKEHQEPSQPSDGAPTYTPSAKPKPKPAVQRGKVYVEVYNNSGITGLAGQVADRATDMGWQVVGSDNWYGTIPATTVYYPERLKRAAKTLALDLGIQRTALAIDPMRRDRLTLILTAPLD
jgi:hypothetical protein